MTGTYDPWLVALSILVAMIGSFTALDLAEQAAKRDTRRAAYWVMGGGFALGLGIWSMHFIGMLAFHLPIPVAYDVPITIASVIPAVIASVTAMAVICHGKRGWPTLLGSSTLIGLGIVVMHYTGMAALKMSPPIDYDPWYFALSVAIAIGASFVAVRVGLGLSPSGSPEVKVGYKIVAAMVLGFAIAGMHYTGMAAARFDAASVCMAAPKGVDSQRLALMIGAGTILLMVFTAAAAAFEARLQERATAIAAKMTQDLERSHHRLLESEVASREAREQLEMVVRGSPLAIYTRDIEGRLTSWNPAAEQMYGWRAEEVLGKPVPTVPPGGEDESRRLRERVLGGENFVHADVKRMRRDGATIDVSATLAPLRDSEGKVRGYVAIAADISDRKRAEGSLRLSARVFDSSNDGIMITTPDATILAVNRAFTRITGYGAEEAIGKTPKLLQSGWQDTVFYQSMWEALLRTGYWRGEIWDRRKDGEMYAQWTSISAVKDEQGTVTHYVGVISDITARKVAEQRLDHLATHDPLTDLPNRTLFHERARRALMRATRSDEMVAVLFLDLDNFKNINDTLGHYVGDLLLQETARRLTECLRAHDTVSRQGGDEFTILLEDMRKPEEAAAVAQKLLEALTRPFQLEGNEVFVTASLGINLCPGDADNLDDLLKNADVAMYHAKAAGRNSFRFYSSDLNAGARERLALETDLRKAIEREELLLHYQPQLDLRTGQVTGVEALLRWRHPERGLLTPGGFMPIAESSGLIVPIGEWVLEEACRQNKAWQRAGLRPITVAVNLSARQFQDGRFPGTIRAVLERAAMDPRFLDLELTETLLMHDIGATAKALHGLRELGVNLSIDDFGTGHSSLNYLKRFPVQRLKIDQSFVRSVDVDPEDAAIARAIISLGHGLGLRVIAEGVETEEQLLYVRSEGCDEVQGFHFSRPLPPDGIVAFIGGKLVPTGLTA
jgi:diguanylate cyclase (GGDEF)-like protein/PAS domain S-box-containing protein